MTLASPPALASVANHGANIIYQGTKYGTECILLVENIVFPGTHE